MTLVALTPSTTHYTTNWSLTKNSQIQIDHWQAASYDFALWNVTHVLIRISKVIYNAILTAVLRPHCNLSCRCFVLASAFPTTNPWLYIQRVGTLLVQCTGLLLNPDTLDAPKYWWLQNCVIASLLERGIEAHNDARYYWLFLWNARAPCVCKCHAMLSLSPHFAWYFCPRRRFPISAPIGATVQYISKRTASTHRP